MGIHERSVPFRMTEVYSWVVSAESRTHRPDGTPRAVSNRRGEIRRLTIGVNDLQTLFPRIASEIIDGDPTQITKGSTKKYSWKCQLGHIYSMSVSQRTQGRGCAVCVGKQINVGMNDLASMFPLIAKEADGWDPKSVTFSSNLNKSWICALGHKWKANVNNRTSQGMGCPFCSGRFAYAGFNDLATTHPEIAKEMYLQDPTKFTFGSGKKVEWKCSEGHLWTSTVSQRVKRDCPTCHVRLKSIVIGKTDLATTHPEIASEADGWDPTTVSKGSGKKLQWKCIKGHTWISSAGKRTSKDPRNCPVCSNQKVLVGYNDLGSTHPQIAKIAFEWDPSTVVAGSSLRRQWICSKGHIYSNAIARVVAGTSCLVCSNAVVQAGINDLVTTNPEIASEANGWDPQEVHIGSHKKLKWRCRLGHDWNAVVRSRLKNGCPVCGNRRILAGFNDLLTHFPDIANEADGWDPSSFVFATTKRMPWICEDGHRWESTIKNRTQLDRGCPSCATSGFDPNEKGWLYFIEHPIWQMLQIGITNNPNRRLSSHKKLGWEIIELRGPMDGLNARNWETSILAMLRIQKADLANPKVAGKFDGFTESWSKSTFMAKSLKDLMDLTEKLVD